ncbi:MAG: guanylate cyclase [Deltaproteobacteria bacterium]|nr:guanylate cyclase [Deltaproteobacteria bacterium]MBN2674542.1 guanylate cyclase [Deltaproteobacteria bacterium]
MMDCKKITSSYSRFVPHQLIDLLGKKNIMDLQLGDQVEKKISILFCDIRNFTCLSETMTPQENFNFINSFLSQMVPLISVNDGIVDKFIGDCIMAIFPGRADDSLNCALQMLKQLRFYNEGRERAGYNPIRIGIGINTGLAMIGTVGGFNRMEGTVISDAVNLASRMESLTKSYDVDLMISENTYNNIGDTFKHFMRFIDRTQVKGKLQPQSIYEVFAEDTPEKRQTKLINKSLFEEALAYYHLRETIASERLLTQYLKTGVDDPPAQIYLERCKNFTQNGMHQGAYELDHQIQWSNMFQINEPVIDAQHKKLVESSLELIEIATDAHRSVFVEKLTKLKQITIEHIHYEESVMAKTDYPFLSHQKEQHRYLTNEFTKLEREAVDTSISMPFLTFKTQIVIVDWLINHTLREDRHLGRHLLAAGDNG